MSHSLLVAPKLSLEFIRKRAKRLLKQIQNQDQEALAWFIQYCPKPFRHYSSQADHKGTSDVGNIKLSDVQWSIAHEYGMSSWPALVGHVNALEDHRRAIASVAQPLDTPNTLHLRCGSDIREGLQQAGFVGEFFEFSDPYCQGPVPAENLIATRIDFISRSYGLPKDETSVRLHREYSYLQTLWNDYENVVLWFEHDSYDQLILAHVLAHMPEEAASKCRLICIDRFPAVKRFNGLGVLDPESLRLLWHRREHISRKVLSSASRIWQALTAPAPSGLSLLAQEPLAELPHMQGALIRHLQELPSLKNGLSLTQLLALEAVREGAQTGGDIFRQLVLETEPRVFLGDLMFFAELNLLVKAARPPLEVLTSNQQQPWPKRRVTLTEDGEKLLAGELDWSECGAAERWVGGVRLPENGPWWRWSMTAGNLQLSLA